MRRVSLFLFLFAFSLTSLYSGWEKRVVGSGMGWASGLVIAPGRNDDTNRLYVAGWNRLYEFTWRNNHWDALDMGPTSGWGVCAGVGRNDGRVRIYATFTVVNPQYGGVYEYTWENGTWQRRTIATFPSSPHSSAGHAVALGRARNDDTIRVYSCDCNNDRTFESTWNGTTWVTNQIFDWSGTDMLIAQGRRDGLYRIYLTKQGSAIREYTWNGQNWEYTELDTIRAYYDIAAGEGRNDTVLRIYSGLGRFGSYGIYEFIWNGENWEKERVKGFPSIPRCVVVGKAKDDGIKRVYAGSTGGRLYALEYTWTGSEWDSSWVDSSGTSSGSYSDAVIGDARNDGINRLYFGCSDGYVYEFTYSSVGVEEEVAAKDFITNHNQSHLSKRGRWEIFTADGRQSSRGEESFLLKAKGLRRGIYFLLYQDRGLRIVKKVIKI